MKNTTSFFFILLTYLSLSSCIPEINSMNASSARRTDDEVMELYEEWMLEHRKVYDALTEKTNRFKIFKENLRYIEEHNNLSNGTYKLGLNQFSDLTYEEFESMYLSDNIPDDDELHESDRNYYVPEAISSLTLPDSVDWRAKGALTPIKYQGRCGSCWAFSAIASVEAINYINTGNLVSLSEQMLVDCVTASHGCLGGQFKHAFKFMTSSGIAQDIDYPYIAVQGPCQEKNITVKIDGYRKVKPRDEGALLNVAATQVISVSVKSNKNVQHYSSGIFSGECGEKLNHSMNVVGYGSENGNKYWILRSSWSEVWGEKGYMKMIRDVEDPEGHCGIAIRPSFPVINSIQFGLRSVI